MRITPLDVRNHVFPRRMNGYDREEVDTFVAERRAARGSR